MAVKTCSTTIEHGPGTPIGYVTDISGFNLSVSDIDISSNASNCTKDYIPGFVDGGKVTVSLNYDATQASTILGLVGTDDIVWKITFADASYAQFTGFICSWDVSAAVVANEVIKNKLEIKVTGMPTLSGD